MQFLLGSRYCETDKLMDIAWANFNSAPLGWGRVQAICDFVHNQITFGYGYARSSRTAYEAYQERVGVCRDFAHLAVTLCRAMNIPARYCTGYRHNTRRTARILIARGRDAADIAISTHFGPSILNSFHVFTDQVAE